MSSRYGQHYTPEQVHNIFAPAEESVNAVNQWLEDEGVVRDRVSQSANKQWLQFNSPVREIETILRTEFYHYEDLSSGALSIGCEE